MFNAPHPWAPFSWDVITSLWRTWYVLALASPLGPILVTSPSFLPWFIGLGGRRHLFSADDAEIYTARLRHPARARASCLLYRSYLRTARDIFIRRRYDHDYLTVPTRLVFGTDDFYVPSAYVAGSAQHARDLDVEFVPGCGHFLPEERSDIAAARVELFLR